MSKFPFFAAVRLPPDQAAALKRLAVATGRTESELHRRALASFLAAQIPTAPPQEEDKVDAT